uniref:Serpentine receptor class gamma n=1 Tax=Steinernema glaseri TaxID=37863 RepID=A0A1I7Z2U9_9BILA
MFISTISPKTGKYEPPMDICEGLDVAVTIGGVTCYVLLYLTTFRNYNKALIAIYLLYEAEQIGKYIIYWLTEIVYETQLHTVFFPICTVILSLCLLAKPFFIYVYFQYYRFLSHEEQYGLQISTTLSLLHVRLCATPPSFWLTMQTKFNPENVLFLSSSNVVVAMTSYIISNGFFKLALLSVLIFQTVFVTTLTVLFGQKYGPPFYPLVLLSISPILIFTGMINASFFGELIDLQRYIDFFGIQVKSITEPTQCLI